MGRRSEEVGRGGGRGEGKEREKGYTVREKKKKVCKGPFANKTFMTTSTPPNFFLSPLTRFPAAGNLPAHGFAEVRDEHSLILINLHHVLNVHKFVPPLLVYFPGILTDVVVKDEPGDYLTGNEGETGTELVDETEYNVLSLVGWGGKSNVLKRAPIFDRG